MSVCEVSSQCSYNLHQIGDDLTPERDGITLGSGVQNWTTVIQTAQKHTAYPIEVCEGARYNFRNCGTLSGAATAWNSIITVVSDSNGVPSSNVLVSNDDFGGAACSGGRSRTGNYTSTFSGMAWILVDTFGCDTNANNSLFGRLDIRHNRMPSDSSNCASADTVPISTLISASSSCAVNNMMVNSCVSDSLHSEDVFFALYSNDNGAEDVIVSVTECQSNSDSVYFIVLDSAKNVCPGNDTLGFVTSCDAYEIYSISSGAFLSNNLPKIRFELDNSSATQGAYFLVMDSPGDSVSCKLSFEINNDDGGWGFDTDGDSAIAFCGSDTDGDGNVWTVDGSDVADVTLEPGESYTLCDTIYTQMNFPGNNGLDRVFFEFGSGWTNITVSSPSGTGNGFYDAAGSWSSSVSGNDVSFSFTSSDNSGADGDNASVAFGYECNSYTFCMEAEVDLKTISVEELDVVVEIRNDNIDSIIDTNLISNVESDFGLQSVFFLPFREFGVSAEAWGRSNSVNWSLYTDHYVDHFIVERSHNGLVFEEIGTVQATVFSLRTEVYQFSDEAPNRGNSYYRIRQINADGEEFISRIVHVYRETDMEAAVQLARVFPNPTNGMLTIETRNAGEEQFRLRVFNTLGAQLQDAVYTASAAHSESVDLTTYAPGIYLVEITQLSNGSSETVMIQRQ